MRFPLSLTCIGIAVLALGCAPHRVSVTPPAPVTVIATVRESPPGDYLRVLFLPAGANVTTLSRQGALRAFATATPLFSPPLKLEEFPNYSGLINNQQNALVAMRCRPRNPETVDALLATWPNVFLAVQRDVPLDPSACTAEPGSAAMKAACFAKAFQDPPQTAVPTSLAHLFSYAGEIYEVDRADVAKWLQDNYGIFPAFSGLGYSVKDSYSLSVQPLNSEQILVKSISPEYILKNVSLSDAGCRCISVAPYPGRSSGLLDPDFIQRAGGDGVCTPVARLPANPR